MQNRSAGLLPEYDDEVLPQRLTEKSGKKKTGAVTKTAAGQW
jgi:hypothetical protein